MNKQLIQARFAKNLKTYDKNAKIQKQMATKLFEMLGNNRYKNILEIGCGTGILTKIIHNKTFYDNYTTVDIVKDCKDYINKISSKIKFINDDIEDFIKNGNDNYDLIISNATIQWIEDFSTFIPNVIDKLSDNGIFIFSTFGESNFYEILKTTGQSLGYKDIKFYEQFFKNYEYSIKEKIYKLKFNTPLEVLMHIKCTGVNAINANTWTKKDLINFEKKYPKECCLTYNPIFIKVQK